MRIKYLVNKGRFSFLLFHSKNVFNYYSCYKKNKFYKDEKKKKKQKKDELPGSTFWHSLCKFAIGMLYLIVQSAAKKTVMVWWSVIWFQIWRNGAEWVHEEALLGYFMLQATLAQELGSEYAGKCL